MCFSSTSGQNNCSTQAHKWCTLKAWEWRDNNGWIVGCNYIPATAINQLEMWQEETFDLACIDKELSWAEDLGFNTIRVFLHHLLWEQDPVGFISRIHQFLSVADKHNIKTMFVLFDAVWDPYPKLGKQPEPKLNIHNSGWVQSPGYDILKNIDAYDSLRSYVEGVVGSFKNDHRVLIWDLFNEPDNTNTASYNDADYGVDKAELALKLLKKTFEWVRALEPIQPLTAAPWKDDWSDDALISELDNFMFSNSDIISFHCYEDKEKFEERLQHMQRFNRPLLCTEYMARHLESTFYDILPLLKKYNVGAFNWGFVAGKTQTHCAWESWQSADNKEPEMWFHDIFRENGEPFDKAEVEFIQNMLKQKAIETYQKVA
ncbi:MAG: cellulase family glycosylhydrolase [Parafilimonas sp.]|nr:cellulase family glycosylhydrolase [Parafilimonas sp.]